MTLQDKDLLLRDLSARLPYGVKCHIPTEDKAMTLTGKQLNYFCFHDERRGVDYNHEYEVVLDPLNDMHNCYIIKPYLRPMSSMTKEELNKLNEYMRIYSYNISHKLSVFYKAQDYLNSIHVDYRGLIEKGLALEAKEGMYNL